MHSCDQLCCHEPGWFECANGQVKFHAMKFQCADCGRTIEPESRVTWRVEGSNHYPTCGVCL